MTVFSKPLADVGIEDCREALRKSEKTLKTLDRTSEAALRLMEKVKQKEHRVQEMYESFHHQQGNSSFSTSSSSSSSPTPSSSSSSHLLPSPLSPTSVMEEDVLFSENSKEFLLEWVETLRTLVETKQETEEQLRVLQETREQLHTHQAVLKRFLRDCGELEQEEEQEQEETGSIKKEGELDRVERELRQEIQDLEEELRHDFGFFKPTTQDDDHHDLDTSF